MQETTKSVDAIAILSGMRNLLADEKCWTKGAPARDAQGLPALSASNESVCWCLMGASNRARSDLGLGVLCDQLAIDALDLALGGGPGVVPSFNDHPDTTHADILAVIDRAIELAKQEADHD